MLTAAGCVARRQRLWQALDGSIEAILVTDPASLTWLSNFRASPFVFNSQEAPAALLAWRDGRCTLIADNVQQSFAAHALVTESRVFDWYRCMHAARHRRQALIHNVVDCVLADRARVWGLETSSCPAAVHAALAAAGNNREIQNIEDALRTARRVKDPDELELLRQSALVAQAGLAEARALARDGMTELELFCMMQNAASASAGMPVEIYGDFVTGPRCQQGGGPPTQRRMRAGELVLTDFSVIVHGYRADFCDTFACQAEYTPRQAAVRSACLSAIAAGERLLRPGTRARDVHAAVRASLAEAGLAEFFPHHAGHGVGLGHPEPPYLVPESDEVLLRGDVVTLEPGVYIPNELGMRFEHCYVITADGFDRLTHHL